MEKSKMNGIALQTLLIHQEGYCSLRRNYSEKFPETIEEGIQSIQGLLDQNLLCRHQVKLLNDLYHKLDALERNSVRIPKDRNSAYALELVVQKIEAIQKAMLNKQSQTPEGFVSLYYLQSFAEPDLGINRCFAQLKDKLTGNTDLLERIATCLPCCGTADCFNSDVLQLIGSGKQGKEVEDALNQKRELLNKFETRKARATSTLSKLQQLRNRDAKTHPSFLEELLKHGYLELYDHFIEMLSLSPDKRENSIKGMSFSTASRIILQVREALIQHVVNACPQADSNVLFLLGGTGSGKTTTLCALRGDQMVLRDDRHYDSRSDRTGIIGHEGDTSCTFLPAIEVIDGLIVVDFPGFDDTRGAIISLGIEFALRHLIARYKPKILVLESVNNHENGLANIGKLQVRLSRLIINAQSCLLGLTKYSDNQEIMSIRGLERDEKSLNRLIAKCRENNDGASLRDHEQELAALRPAEAKEGYKSRLKKTEDTIVEKIGLKRILRFDHLHEPSVIAALLKELVELPPSYKVEGDDLLKLHPHDEALLWRLFIDNSPPHQPPSSQAANNSTTRRSILDFEERVLETSLMFTIFNRSHPEIGQLLHIPEIDPSFVRKCDQHICTAFLKKYIVAIVSALDLNLINQMLEEFKTKADSQLIQQLEKELADLKSYVEGLEGIHGENGREQNQTHQRRSWNDIRETIKDASKSIEDRFTFPQILRWLEEYLSIRVPSGIKKLILWNETKQAESTAMNQVLGECLRDIQHMQETLNRLKILEAVLQKKEILDEALQCIEFNLDNLTELAISIIGKISKVRRVYGEKEWDKRVEYLAAKCSLGGYDKKLSGHVQAVIAYAYNALTHDAQLNTYKPTEALAYGLITIEADASHPFNPSEIIKTLIPKEETLPTESIPDLKKYNRINANAKTIHVVCIARCPEMNPFFRDFISRGSPLNRVLAAAALFRAHNIPGVLQTPAKIDQLV